jgi:hypothetical protein
MIITDFDSTLDREGWRWMFFGEDGYRVPDGSDSAHWITLSLRDACADVLRFELIDEVWTIVASDTHDISQFDPTAYRSPTDFAVVPFLAES